jgi:hypothetical protein
MLSRTIRASRSLSLPTIPRTLKHNTFRYKACLLTRAAVTTCWDGCDGKVGETSMLKASCVMDVCRSAHKRRTVEWYVV